eukprot:g31208.t1
MRFAQAILTFLELGEDDLLWQLELEKPKHVAGPSELVSHHHSLDDGAIGCFKDDDVSVPVLPADAENPSQTAVIRLLKGLEVAS